ncbi:MAG: hypothetical protein IKI29_01620 [Clostridia bacterium]|nr:hypothetical protein [Clostridia bacterium]
MKDNAFLKVFFGVLVAVYFIHQIYAFIYHPIQTESAEYYEMVDGLKISATLIRDEQVVINASGGILHFLADDGSRVAKNGVIANIYSSENDSVLMTEKDAIAKKIADIEELQNYNNLQASDLNLANENVSAAFNGFIRATSNGNFDRASQNAEELLSTINHRQIITGEQTDFTAQLSALNERLQQLNNQLPNATGYLSAQRSGYFVSATDGFESVLNPSMLDSVTPEYLNQLKKDDPAPGAVGKLVSDFEWYLAAKVSINDSLRFKVGDALEIRTSLLSMPTLTATVKQINLSQKGEQAVVIFSCNQMSSELATMRTGNMTVVSNIYQGLRLPKKALRVVDGKTGVFVYSGMSLKFVTVKVIYQNDEIIICEQQQTDTSVLRLYDEVVVKGKKLYDGKIIN